MTKGQKMKDQKTKNQKTAGAVPFPDEIIHLSEISQKLDDAIVSAEESVRRLDKDYMDMKRYMTEYRGEIDPHEMFQNESGLRQMDHTGAFAAEVWERLVKLRDSPYFARIDFRCDGSTETEQYYIGRFAFHCNKELLILDWRSPAAGMFYDHEVGHADYTAPDGKIEGEMTRKRQFKIENGILEYALESTVNISDNVLQQELSRTSDEKMKSIITTIQREQNKIIRNESTKTLIIQGVAGSGKTSIALHRVAFLLYRWKDKLTAGNITILSPNKVFGDYISNILPELGEEPIYEVSFREIAEVQLENKINFEFCENLWETDDTALSERVQFKSTLNFVHLMDKFIEQIPNTVFKPTDYTDGNLTADKEWIGKRFQAYSRYPVSRRLQMTAEDIHSRFDADNYMADSIPSAKVILKALNRMLTVKSSLSLYKEFYKQNHVSHMFRMSAPKTLEWSDVYPFLYIKSAFEGLKESSKIKHLLIDEMQDYTPIQYAVINKLFRCPKTILGDFEQWVHPAHRHTLSDLEHLYPQSQLISLTKSYRSTYEIITFAQHVKQGGTIEPVERHGEFPEIIPCKDLQDEILQIKNRMAGFRKQSFSSLGIVTKTNHDAQILYDSLSSDQDVFLISPESTHFRNGVSVTSVQMSKGLEFDEVIIPDAGSKQYCTEYDRGLLYIACTRAMHRLCLFYTDKISPII